MNKFVNLLSFVLLSAAIAFGQDRIDQGSTADGHSHGCTLSNPFPGGQTNPCVFFVPTSFGGIVESLALGSSSPSLVADVFYLDGTSGAPVKFSQTSPNVKYGVFLCGGNNQDGAVSNATLSGNPLCVNLSNTTGYFDPGNITTFNYSLTGLNTAGALTNNTLVFYVTHNGGTFSLESPTQTIKVNFGSTDSYTESCGTSGTASASGLTADQKTAVIGVIQKEYDDALGAGRVTVSEGTGGDVNVIIDGGNAPGGLKGKEYGDAGKPGKSAVVHVKEFLDNGFSDTGLTNGIGETAAHEAGHKFGLDHNHDNPPSKMTDGGDATMTIDVRKADNRTFNADDKRKLMMNFGITGAESKDTAWTSDLIVQIGTKTTPPANEPDDLFINGSAFIVTAPTGTQFGLRTATNFFLFKGDTTNTPGNPTPWTFEYTAGVDAVVFYNNNFYTLANGTLAVQLSNPNPNNSLLWSTADILGNTPDGMVDVQINLEVGDNTGGFFLNPCTPGLNDDINIVPVISPNGVFCFNNWGASDTMFVGTPPLFYDQSLDVLSGDSAANLRYFIGGQLASGKGWLTPYMDGGNLVPSYSTGSRFQVLTPTRYLGNSLLRTESEIFDPSTGADVKILGTFDDPSALTETFIITNSGSSIFQNLSFADYANLHPNGSLTGTVNSQLSYNPAIAAYFWSGDTSMSSFISNFAVMGDSPDNAHGAGLASPSGLIGAVENGTYNGATTFGPADAAGALLWTLPNLGPGQSSSIRTHLVPLAPAANINSTAAARHK